MGCFSTCFHKSNRRKSNRKHRRVNKQPCLLDHLQKDDFLDSLQVTKSIEQENVEKAVQPTPESHDDEQKEKDNTALGEDEQQKEKENLSARKKVTFDLNVRVYEHVENASGDGEGSDDEKEGRQERAIDQCSHQPQSSDSSNCSSLFSYPPNNRYQNCRDSEDELDESASDASGMGDDDDDDDYFDFSQDDEDKEEEDCNEENICEINDDDGRILVEKESSGSLFSLSIDSRKQKPETEMEKEVNSPMLIKNPSVKKLKPPTGLLDINPPEAEMTKFVADSVLSPVENRDQWQAVKARARLSASKKQQPISKENIISALDNRKRIPVHKRGDPTFQKVSIQQKQAIAVDTSLSSWLAVSSEAATATTPNSRTSSVNSVSEGNSAVAERRLMMSSPGKYDEDGPILGALTIDEIKQFSATSTPRRSPGRSPDDMVIIGTVGSYWSHTGQGSTGNSDSGSVSTSRRSRYREDDKVCWNTTPFETMLETALQNRIPQA